MEISAAPSFEVPSLNFIGCSMGLVASIILALSQPCPPFRALRNPCLRASMRAQSNRHSISNLDACIIWYLPPKHAAIKDPTPLNIYRAVFQPLVQSLLKLVEALAQLTECPSIVVKPSHVVDLSPQLGVAAAIQESTVLQLHGWLDQVHAPARCFERDVLHRTVDTDLTSANVSGAEDGHHIR